YWDRLQSEMEIIKGMGFPGYFLVVWDFIKFAKDSGIPVGPGRGSAAGSVVAWSMEITDIDPLEYDLLFERFLNLERITMPDIDVVEKMGLLKMDCLGLRTLTVIDDAIKSVKAQTGETIDITAIPLDDPEVYRLFQEGRTKGVFQFESGGMVDVLRRAKPTKFEDLAAFNALYRPGALDAGMVDEYVKRKTASKPKYLVPALSDILEETYGIIVYQEQVLRVAQAIAGFSLGDADFLRKAMGK